MMVHTYNPSTPEMDAGGSRDTVIYPQLYCEFKSSLGYMWLFEKKNKKKPKQETNQVRACSPRNNTWGCSLTSVYLCTLMHVYICPYLSPPTPTHTQTPFSPLIPLSKLTANLSNDFNIVLQKTYLCGCGVCGWSQRPEDRSSGDEVTGVCEPLYGRWDLSSGPHD